MFSCFLLFLVCTAQAFLTVVDSSCETVDCHSYLATYVKQLNSKVTCTNDKWKFTCTIAYAKPKADCAGLYAKAFGVNGEKTELTDFTKTEDTDKFFLHMSFSPFDSKSPIKCQKLVHDPEYKNYECVLEVDYFNSAKDVPLETYLYKVTARAPHDDIELEIIINGNQIYENGCDCELVGSFKYETKLYKGFECKDEIAPGSFASYGDYLCIAIFGTDAFSSSFDYDITSLQATYKKSDETSTYDMLNIALVKCSLDNACKRGQVYIILPLINTGLISFKAVVVFNNYMRLMTNEVNLDLKSMGATVEINEVLETTDVDQLFESLNPDDPTNKGSSLMVSFVTFLASLFVVL